MPTDRDDLHSHGGQKPSLTARLGRALLRPAPEPAAPSSSSGPRSAGEVEAEARSADDKERMIGLVAAPLAAAIGLLATGSLIANDPPARLADGQLNRLHVSVGLYHELTLVVLGLSVVMLAAAFFRKRLYVGIAMAAYGLALFNMHYWGFGLPFIMAGSWYLVRAYRLQKELRLATGGGSSGRRPSGAGASGRYTPPAATRRNSGTRYRPAPVASDRRRGR